MKASPNGAIPDPDGINPVPSVDLNRCDGAVQVDLVPIGPGRAPIAAIGAILQGDARVLKNHEFAFDKFTSFVHVSHLQLSLPPL